MFQNSYQPLRLGAGPVSPKCFSGDLAIPSSVSQPHFFLLHLLQDAELAGVSDLLSSEPTGPFLICLSSGNIVSEVHPVWSPPETSYDGFHTSYQALI